MGMCRVTEFGFTTAKWSCSEEEVIEDIDFINKSALDSDNVLWKELFAIVKVLVVIPLGLCVYFQKQAVIFVENIC